MEKSETDKLKEKLFLKRCTGWKDVNDEEMCKNCSNTSCKIKELEE